jgi:hypothetical protein
MTKVVDPSKEAPHHGLFYMENAGGCERGHPENPPQSMAPDERQPSCFALEEEKGEDWKGGGAMKPAISQKRPTL